ncbi:MAG TPA: serpin family protein [Streptosporangiaceae bacterium]|nr:serpin family protein [Streptosporangiaceae bacterium]
MNKHLTAVGLVITASLALAGCATDTSQAVPIVAHGVAASEPAVSPRPYGAADTSFGLDLLGAWCRTDPRANLVLSPASLASGLGMAYLGARGGTAQAMAGALHLPATSGQALEAGLQARSAALRNLDSPGVTLDASDQVWADPGLTTLHSYLNAVATGYDAGVAQVPLLRNPDQAAREINQTIAAATRGEIPQLLAPGSLRGIGWVLTDALYLQAAWASPFQADLTSPGPFTTATGQKVSVPFMNGGPYRTADASGWTGVWLPYRGGRLAMLALLPPAGAGACATPATTALAGMTARLAGPGTAGGTTQDVALPRVSVQDQVSLKGLLSGLGMGVAFSPAADFAGLSPQACCIGLVEHAATLKVGEQGTVAGAATAVGIVPTAARLQRPPVAFDRPYLMLVTDSATGEPLFLARVADPATR